MGEERLLEARGGENVQQARGHGCHGLLKIQAAAVDLGEITSELVRGLHAAWGPEEWLSMHRARVGCPPGNSGHGKKRTEAQREDLVAAGLVCFCRTRFVAER